MLKLVAIKIIDKKLTAIKIAKSIHRKKKYLEDEGILPSPTLSLETTLSNSIPSYPSCSWVNIISPISTPLNLFGTNTVDILLSEVKLMMRLNHPNIIKLYQVIDTEAECFIIMDYAAGGEFVDYLASKGRLTEAEARHYFRQLVSAVHHCHSANLVHRDLKLENLLLTHHQELLLSDFGLGRTFYKKEDLMYTFCGTPSYAAIELIQHRPYCGMPADVWSMGVILFVMCSGSMPFFGTTLSSLYKRILGLDYQCPSYFSEGKRT
ncbi:SIK kinase 3 [Coelomomyces lativittatus]|nr:SIK kinase 3 [Coelomomyces lativittatus]